MRELHDLQRTVRLLEDRIEWLVERVDKLEGHDHPEHHTYG